MSYVKYSDEQKRKAVEIDMLDFLNQEYGYTFKKQGNEYHCQEHSSLVINQNHCRWYWNSQHIGGNNAVDWLMKIENKSYPQAMYTLVGRANVQDSNKTIKYSSAPAVNEEKENKELQLPAHSKEQYKKATAYLCKTRNIDSNIVFEMIKSKRIYQDEKNNAVFVGYDEEKKPKFACVRGTLSDVQYRQDCYGSDKSYAFGYSGIDKSSVFVFESPIDLMSHATMFNHMTNNKEMWKEHTRISLAGTSDTALSKFTELHPEVKNIYICLDNDEAGQKASKFISEKYSAKGYNTQILPPKTKDYNSDLAVYISSNTQSIQKQKSY